MTLAMIYDYTKNNKVEHADDQAVCASYNNSHHVHRRSALLKKGCVPTDAAAAHAHTVAFFVGYLAVPSEDASFIRI